MRNYAAKRKVGRLLGVTYPRWRKTKNEAFPQEERFEINQWVAAVNPAYHPEGFWVWDLKYNGTELLPQHLISFYSGKGKTKSFAKRDVTRFMRQIEIYHE